MSSYNTNKTYSGYLTTFDYLFTLLMKINREGKSKVLDTKELDLLLDYLPNNKHKLLAQVLRKTASS